MSDFVERWLTEQLRAAEPNSLRLRLLEGLRECTRDGSLDDAAFRSRLLADSQETSSEDLNGQAD